LCSWLCISPVDAMGSPTTAHCDVCDRIERHSSCTTDDGNNTNALGGGTDEFV
jgi:hypothetical protein